MKGGIAAFMAAIGNTDLSKLKRGLTVYCTYDEERSCLRHQRPGRSGNGFSCPCPGRGADGHGTDDRLERAAGIHLHLYGGYDHSSTPIDGKNSNKNAVRFLNRMLDF